VKEPTRPFELDLPEIKAHLADLVQVTFDDLTSQFMLLPKGDSFLDYSGFQAGYEALRRSTDGFTHMDADHCWVAVRSNAIAGIVLRTILGISPPEWQELAKEETGEVMPSNWARTLDKSMRTNPKHFASHAGISNLTVTRTTALFEAACRAITEGGVQAPQGMIHRLEKFDTKEGLDSLHYVSEQHIPYAVLWYERYLGRPFASHRDAVSELVGDVMENAVEDCLAVAHVPFRKTKRAERVPGFDQAPDFFIPDELEPAVIIEAKITGDDGTARDKVARIKVLAQMRDEKERNGEPAFEVVACIDGRGFGVRREDMGQLICATRGKVFTGHTLHHLIENTRLRDYAIRAT